MDDNYNYVVCKICGWHGRQLNTAHLHFTHGIKAKDYLARFPDASLTCEASRAKMRRAQKNYYKKHPGLASERSKQIWKDPEKRKRYIEGFKKRLLTEDHKKKISETMKKVYANTPFILRRRNETQFGENNPFFGKTHSDKTKKKIGIITSKKLKDAYANGRRTSPFAYLGNGKELSQYEQLIYEYLVDKGFIYDYKIPFSKGCYLIDFANPEEMLAIELDSELHKKTKARDQKKDKYLNTKGWRVIRIPFRNLETPKEVLQKVKEVIKNESNIRHRTFRRRNISRHNNREEP